MARPTTLKYIIDTGAATSRELLELSKVDPEGGLQLRKWADEEMDALGMVPLSTAK